MVKLHALKTDPELENAGVWVEWEMGVQLKVARIGNKEFQAMTRRLLEPYQKEIRGGKGMDRILEVSKKVCAKHILLGWKGIEEEDGKALKYSASKALELLEDEALRDLYDFVITTANDKATYRRELDEDGAKN